MSTFEFPESIKSRPTYGKLEKRAGKLYLFIADAEGAEAALEKIDTKIQFANIFTEGLKEEDFVRLRILLCGW